MKSLSFRAIYDKLQISGPPIISICEPNRDTTKMSLYPILGANKISDATIMVYGRQNDITLTHLDLTNVSYEPRKPIYEIL